MHTYDFMSHLHNADIGIVPFQWSVSSQTKNILVNYNVKMMSRESVTLKAFT